MPAGMAFWLAAREPGLIWIKRWLRRLDDARIMVAIGPGPSPVGLPGRICVDPGACRTRWKRQNAWRPPRPRPFPRANAAKLGLPRYALMRIKPVVQEPVNPSQERGQATWPIVRTRLKYSLGTTGDRMPATGPSSASPGTEQRILIVDDDAEIVALLTRYLSGHGFRVSAAGNGAELRVHVEGAGTDVILLDLGLPDEDGLGLLRYLQGAWSGPVIVVSGRGEPVERVVGLELGADDFVSKPFDLRELLARIRSVLRRTAKTPALTAQSNVFEFSGFRLDLAARRLTDPQGDEVALTTGDFQLLCALLDKPRQVLSRDELMDALYRREAGPFDRAVDMGIGRLRRKLEPNPEAPALIKSVRGVGYLFASEVVRS